MWTLSTITPLLTCSMSRLLRKLKTNLILWETKSRYPVFYHLNCPWKTKWKSGLIECRVVAIKFAIWSWIHHLGYVLPSNNLKHLFMTTRYLHRKVMAEVYLLGWPEMEEWVFLWRWKVTVKYVKARNQSTSVLCA